jgi:hypothetical protein
MSEKFKLAQKRNWFKYSLMGRLSLKHLDKTIMTKSEINIINKIEKLRNELIINFSKNNKRKGLKQ